MSMGQGSREKIVASARDLFYRVGYQATSVDDILRDCKVAKSNFYYHYQSKEQLGLEVLEQRRRELLDVIQLTLNNESLAPSIRIERFHAQVVLAYAQGSDPAGCPFGTLAAALPTPSADPNYEVFRMQVSGIFRELEEAARRCVVVGVALREFREDIDVDDLAAYLVASVQGFLMMAKTYQDTRSLERGFRVMQQLLRRADLD